MAKDEIIKSKDELIHQLAEKDKLILKIINDKDKIINDKDKIIINEKDKIINDKDQLIERLVANSQRRLNSSKSLIYKGIYLVYLFIFFSLYLSYILVSNNNFDFRFLLYFYDLILWIF